MKLKEKLAKEFVRNTTDMSDDPGTVGWDGFIAGFEKCREMAACECEGARRKYYGYLYHDALETFLLKDIQNLGEEEVE
jgi:hypothetical protein